MVGFARLVIVALVVVGLLYAAASMFLRARQRKALAAAWTPEHGDRDLYVAQRLKAYDRWLRPRLAFWLIVLPMVYFAVVLYLSGTV